MNTEQAYNQWARTYDTDPNKTRDLEQVAARRLLAGADFSTVLEIGCGTGKNTTWLAENAGTVTAADFSEEMMKRARAKTASAHVRFVTADLTQPWMFDPATLIVCSLVLEHIDNLDFIFEQAARTLEPGGWFYVCELHPYKQLQGSRARFEQGDQTVHLEYFVHHVSDFFSAAQKHGLTCLRLEEWFDDTDRNTTPRLVSFVFQRQR